MAVKPETVARQWAGSTGSVDRDGPVEYTAVWHLQVTDALDQAQTIVIWWQLNRFPLGTEYAYGNDLIGSLATAKNISATRKPETTDWWNVVVKYSRESDDAKKDSGDEHTTDPLEYRPEVHCSSSTVTVPGDKMFYLGGYHPLIGLLIGGAATVPVASNMTPFDPLPEVEEEHWYVSVKKNLETFDGANAFVSFLNSAEFTIDYKGFTHGPIKPRQAKIRDCEVAFERENTVDFWAVRYYIEILPAGKTWEIELPDIGMHGKACKDDPDMHGGFYDDALGQGAPESIKPVPGRSKTHALIDPHGMPIRSPVLLDGTGKPLDVCTEPVSPFYSKWWRGLETDFNKVPVIDTILAPVGK